MLLGLFSIMFFPCVIVAFWRSRPRVALILAGVVLLLPVVISGLLKTYQAAMMFPNSHSVIAVGVSDTINLSLKILFVGLPFLFIFQYAIRKLFPSKQTPPDTFD